MFVVRCSVFVVCCLCCLLFVGCLLFVVRWLWFVACCCLFVARCLFVCLFVGGGLWCAVRGLLLVVWCLCCVLFCWLLSVASCLCCSLFGICWSLRVVCCLMFAVCVAVGCSLVVVYSLLFCGAVMLLLC